MSDKHVTITTAEAHHFARTVGVELPTSTYEPVLLSTGAKLYKVHNIDAGHVTTYIIGGYHYAGEDVTNLPLSRRVRARVWERTN